MRSEIKKLHEKLQTTFIYVTHDQTEALTMGDRIVLLNNGDIQQVDTPEEVYNNPKNTFVAGFIGSPQINFIDGRDLGLNEEILYGIRPEKMNNPNGDIKLNVEVEISEMLGSEKIAYFNIGERKCCAKLPSEYVVGKTLEISINSNDLYKFNKQTGERIY
jgi:multiple sugar transport system ATP-binding protein